MATCKVITIAAVIGLLATPAQANVVMDWVTVGDPGNVDDTHGDGYGGVNYTYNIGKYEVTAGQYTEFLNAVAATDTYGLYNTNMWTEWISPRIRRTGSSGSYTYSVLSSWVNRPVSWVSWYDTLRFANWMHNGQPTGAQDASTTEDGAYDMSLGSAVVRKPGALVFLPSEDEWYKAAYYKGGGTSAGYWDYPTAGPSGPAHGPPPGTDMTNGSANYWNFDGFVDDYFYTTEVGAYDAMPSDSAYGTFDQGGNVWEWNEADLFGDGSYRGVRGGSFSQMRDRMQAAYRTLDYPAWIEGDSFGFRVAAVPEPGTLSLLALGGLLAIRRRRQSDPARSRVRSPDRLV